MDRARDTVLELRDLYLVLSLFALRPTNCGAHPHQQAIGRIPMCEDPLKREPPANRRKGCL